jgi:hypothetical protein
LDPNFQKIEGFEIGAVYYDWDKKAIEYLKSLCDKN